MISFPNCKINLGLNIIAKRTDGYHDLETVFYPLQLKDAVEIIQSEITNLSISGLPVDGNATDNLCIKAYHLLKNDFPDLPPVNIHLHKIIPLGAGLGGGSSDGAFMLKLINDKFNLQLSSDELLTYAKQLGSDCPFFILNKSSYATGRGENLEEINLNLTGYKIIIIYPEIQINTGWAFSNIKPVIPAKSIKEIIKQPVSTWKEELKNDFETPVFSKYPEIKKIKDNLYNAGALYSSMSGSGSSVFGIFNSEKTIPLLLPENYFVKELACQF
jgi:4-diphosphocytidyl-2-C-methyl-D-erythritol kinase